MVVEKVYLTEYKCYECGYDGDGFIFYPKSSLIKCPKCGHRERLK